MGLASVQVPQLCFVQGGRPLGGLKKTVIKELLWGTTQDIARTLVDLAADGSPMPASPSLRGQLVVEYCGG